mgnify:CR=1 FL=1
MSDDISFEDNAQASPKSVLIVEDDAPDLVLARKKVKSLWPDCVVMPVRSLKAVHKAYAKHKFDLVLLDLNLPDGFGPRTVEDIRKIDKNVPIIVVSGMVSDGTVSECLKLGANNVVPKSQLMGNDFFNILKQNFSG